MSAAIWTAVDSPSPYTPGRIRPRLVHQWRLTTVALSRAFRATPSSSNCATRLLSIWEEQHLPIRFDKGHGVVQFGWGSRPIPHHPPQGEKDEELHHQPLCAPCSLQRVRVQDGRHVDAVHPWIRPQMSAPLHLGARHRHRPQPHPRATSLSPGSTSTSPGPRQATVEGVAPRSSCGVSAPSNQVLTTTSSERTIGGRKGLQPCAVHHPVRDPCHGDFFESAFCAVHCHVFAVRSRFLFREAPSIFLCSALACFCSALACSFPGSTISLCDEFVFSLYV
ncbi:uncharacterized protein LOC119280856 [Triticum dicoccoides]|uniref:uncharacterized protein LOC119280856 n=1 Tax=Triticum dicoccoides TaxID=85692 RepID=UPI00189046C2|nr:uncharacterized protein LOC119280856 [Triticum dicoccoides]